MRLDAITALALAASTLAPALGAQVVRTRTDALLDGGDTTLATQATATTATVAPGKYRVTITGFKVRQESYDNLLQLDGKRDEVFVTADVRLVDPAGNAVAPVADLRTPTYGDRNGFPSRVQAGTASSLGGLRTGDAYDVAGALPQRDRLPLVVYEGPLAKDGNTAVIVPAVWEADNEPGGLTTWIANQAQPVWQLIAKDLLAQTTAMIGTAGLYTADGKPITTTTESKTFIGALGQAASAIVRSLSQSLQQFAQGDRPIGLDASNAFAPKAVPLDFDLAELAVAQGSNGVPGVIEVPYDDVDALKGRYTLYLRVQRIP
jgi:hypothetical protein